MSCTLADFWNPICKVNDTLHIIEVLMMREFQRNDRCKEILKSISAAETTKVEFGQKLLKYCGFKNFIDQQFQMWNKLQKDTSISETVRTIGNSDYKNKNYDEALLHYNMAINSAPINSVELTLAYANRAALYLTTKHYDECMADIQRVKELKNYPQPSKIEEREQKCTLAMENVHDGNIENFHFNAKLVSGANKNIPFVSKCMSAKKDGSTVVVYTKKELIPGDIIAIEKPVFFVPVTLYMYVACGNCMKSGPLIPCPYCVNALYCDDKCMKEAWDNYHKYECPLSNFLYGSFDYARLLALRLTFWAFNLFKDDLQELEEMLKNRNNFCKLTVFDESCSNFDKKQQYKMIFGQAMGFNELQNDVKLQFTISSTILNDLLNNKSQFLKLDIRKRIFNELFVHNLLICYKSMVQLRQSHISGKIFNGSYINCVFPFGGRVKYPCIYCANALATNDGLKSYLVAAKRIAQNEAVKVFYDDVCVPESKKCLTCNKCAKDNTFKKISQLTENMPDKIILPKLFAVNTRKNAFQTLKWLRKQFHDGKVDFNNISCIPIMFIFLELYPKINYTIEEPMTEEEAAYHEFISQFLMCLL